MPPGGREPTTDKRQHRWSQTKGVDIGLWTTCDDPDVVVNTLGIQIIKPPRARVVGGCIILP